MALRLRIRKRQALVEVMAATVPESVKKRSIMGGGPNKLLQRCVMTEMPA